MHVSGVLDDAGAYWRAKWDQVKAKFLAVLGTFLGLRDVILTRRQRLGVALDRAEKAGQTQRAAEIRAALDEGEQLLTEQARLESEAQSAHVKIQEIESGAVGIIPLLAVAGVVGIVAVVAGAIVIHTQRTQTWNKRAELLEAGLISPEDLAGDAFSIVPDWVWVAGAGALAWWLWRKK